MPTLRLQSGCILFRELRIAGGEHRFPISIYLVLGSKLIFYSGQPPGYPCLHSGRDARFEIYSETRVGAYSATLLAQ